MDDLEAAVQRLRRAEIEFKEASAELQSLIAIRTARVMPVRGYVNRAEGLTRLHAIQNIVANYFGVTVEALNSKGRPASIAFPRQVAMMFCRRLTSLTLEEIGNAFGGRDHGTVKHAFGAVADRCGTSAETKTKIDALFCVCSETLSKKEAA